MNVPSSGDKTVTFSEAFDNPPIVLATGIGNNRHSITCLRSMPAKASFSTRLIHCTGAWETGKISWAAFKPTDSTDDFTVDMCSRECPADVLSSLSISCD